MRCRCHNEKDSGYHKYGAKGISVCDEWRNSFESFYSWSISNGYRDGLTIDRINPNGNYEPSNCRWVTMIDQQRNRGNNIKIEHNGETHTISEWCEILNFSYTCAKTRYFRLLKSHASVSFEDVFEKRNGYRNRKIGQFSPDGNLIKVWDKMADIHRSGIDRVSVSRCCAGKISKSHGFVWKYIE